MPSAPGQGSAVVSAPTLASGVLPQGFNAVEVYKGVVVFAGTVSGPGAPNCTPNPLVVKFNATFGGFELDVDRSLLTSGPFTAVSLSSTFSAIVVTPAVTCSNPDGTTTVVPGTSTTTSSPAGGGAVAGSSSVGGCSLIQPGLSVSDTALAVIVAGQIQFNCSSPPVTLNAAEKFSLTRQ